MTRWLRPRWACGRAGRGGIERARSCSRCRGQAWAPPCSRLAGIMGALMVRESTGRGQALDATLAAGLDPIDYFVSTVVQVMAKRGEKPSADARAATAASRFGVLLATRDGRFIQTSTMLPHQGKALCEVAGIAHVLEDPRFKGLPTFANAEDAQEWEDLLQEAFRAKDLDHWLPLLQASPNVAFEVAVTSEEGLTHPQIVHNGDVVTIDDPARGAIRQVGPVGHFDKTPIGPTRSAPDLGDNAGPLVAHEFPAGGSAAPKHPFDGRHGRRVRLLLRNAVRDCDARGPRRAGDQDRRRRG